MTMTVGRNVATLSGRCGAEDAEPLLLALQDDPLLVVDLSTATRLHTAVVQILVALKPAVRGLRAHPVLQSFILAETAKE